jgi:hypothetical protein
MCKTLNELNLEMMMEKPVYDFAPLEAVVNGWIRERLADEANPGQEDLFGKTSGCDVEGVPV